jgi:hypothetical protein
MWSKKLENKIAKHRAYGKEILTYANSVLGVGLRFTSVNKLAGFFLSRRILQYTV